MIHMKLKFQALFYQKNKLKTYFKVLSAVVVISTVSIFFFLPKIGLYSYFKLSSQKTFHLKCQSLFSNENNINI